MNILIFQKDEYLFWMNILDFCKMNNVLNKHFGFTLPASIMVVAKCLKLIWNQSGIISRTYFSPFQGVYYLYRGLRRAPKPYFCLILEFWIIFLIFYEWIILLNILDSVEWIFFWMNILDFGLNWILNWIIFRPASMKKWIFKTDRPGLAIRRRDDQTKGEKAKPRCLARARERFIARAAGWASAPALRPFCNMMPTRLLAPPCLFS